MNPQADRFFEKAKKWNAEYHLLREIVCEDDRLEEDFKWMHPCYTFEKKNVVLIHGFKNYCALLFTKGALIDDTANVLITQTVNVQSARQIRFTGLGQILALKSVIKDYIDRAIAIEKSGGKVTLKKVEEYSVPEEFQKALAQDSAFSKAFHSLTPGRQKGYLFHFGQAKQAKTREARIEKYYQQILDGKGLDD